MSIGDAWFQSKAFSVESLLDMVERSEIALPEFQRSFKWTAPDVASLLRSIARNWPAGSLLLLEMTADVKFGIRSLTGGPDLERSQVKWMLLDGQQRTTALFQALRSNSNTVYFIDINGLRSSDEFEDEHLQYMRKDRFYKRYDTLAAQAKAGVLEVSVLSSETNWDRWLRYFTDISERESLIELKRQHLAGLVQYHFPANIVEASTSLAAIAKIFETINRRGLTLDAFDLMVAMLYPHDFRLRDEWDTVFDERSIFKELNFKTGLEVLQLIALREHLTQKAEYASGHRKRILVKGVRQSDLLELDPVLVKENWSNAVAAYERALEFIKSRCGGIRPNLVAQSTMVLPLADAFYSEQLPRTHYEDDLERWYWAAAFTQAFGQGANTRAVSETEALRAWASSESAAPSVVARFDTDRIDLLETSDRNRILARALMARLVVRDARDWILHDRLDQLDGDVSIDFHHIIPESILSKRYYGTPFPDGVAEDNPLAVMTPLSGSTNKSLRDKSGAALEAAGVRESELTTHCIDATQLVHLSHDAGSIRDFLEDRSTRLKALMRDAVEGR